MARGGRREGAGRKAGSANTRSAKLEQTIAILTGKKKATKPPGGGAPASASPASDADKPFGPVINVDGELLPLDFLLATLRDDCMPFGARMLAAEKAAPYCHPKLSTVEHKGGLDITTHEAALKELS